MLRLRSCSAHQRPLPSHHVLLGGGHGCGHELARGGLVGGDTPTLELTRLLEGGREGLGGGAGLFGFRV